MISRHQWVGGRVTGLIIFDCDGVIADSELLSASVLIDSLATLDIHLTATDVRRDFLGRSFPTVAGLIRQRCGKPLPEDFEQNYRQKLLSRFETELQPTPGLHQMLDHLRLPICVATSSSPPRVARTLSILGLSQRFGSNVFTASQVPRGKPAPDLFLLAAKIMDVEPAAIVVIEDSTPGIEAGLAAGMRVLNYRGGAHLTGLPSERADVPSFDNWSDLNQLLNASHEGADCREFRTLHP